ncbi:LytTR family two component transcriptional regulator [Scopulibacillus darangshiensis]|uniref:LytTR family two component transcriptional regulator n=1 Tax=Scopulibacillus darangshiensis TaxID=442528 RepID=A0A4R2NJC9_9BACL|nr:LytTR family DNA-binding domain-containing protein [Scopulibacillus darangshiensis]TCP21659.1 LytTR family two component transcriptional regulator [Scopulibacillus darangshiensis]
MKAYVVEDELYARNELIFILRQTGQVDVIGETDDIHKAIWDIPKMKPDVVFLDIHFTRGNGVELAKQLQAFKEPPLLVFVTAYDEYAAEAFDLEAVDYIVKPFSDERIIKSVDRLLSQMKVRTMNEEPPLPGTKDPGKLVVKDSERIIIIDTKEIVYVGTENRQVFVKTLKRKYPTETPLYELEKRLGSAFHRVHRGYIVNLDLVVEIEPWFNGACTLGCRDGSRVPVSRSYIREVKQLLGF